MFSTRQKEIAQKIRSLQAVAIMNGLKVLIITDRPILGEYEPTPFQAEAEGRDEYKRIYLENLADLGTEVIVRPQEEMVSRTEAANEGEAEEVAQKWIEETVVIKGTNQTQIRESAKLYLAMGQMMKEHDADTITTEGYGVFMNYEPGPIPSQGLPSSQFCIDGIVATSETLVDSLVTQQLGLLVTGNTGLNGDYAVDKENHKAYVGHCECPFNPYGDRRRGPYIIRNLLQWSTDQQEKGEVCVQVFLPAGETVTVAKISVHGKKLSCLPAKRLMVRSYLLAGMIYCVGPSWRSRRMHSDFLITSTGARSGTTEWHFTATTGSSSRTYLPYLATSW